MVNANELRIGNWVNKDNFVFDYMGGSRNVPVLTQVTIDNFRKVSSECESIPLTPDILEQCGFFISKIPFDQDYSLYEKNEDTFFLQFDWRRRNEGYSILVRGDEFISIGNNVKYIHELQNVFHSLYQTELLVNLNTKQY